MIYEITARLLFNTRDPIDDIVDKIVDHFDEAILINPDDPNIEFSSYAVIENHHDEAPNAPCTLLIYNSNRPPQPE